MLTKQSNALRRDSEWVKRRAREYPGEWLAVRNGDLVAHKPTFRDLIDTVAEIGYDTRELLIFCVGTDGTTKQDDR